MLGLGTDDEPEVKKADEPSQKDGPKTADNKTSQSEEAKAILAKMEEKKDAGDCAFC